ncbi:hypothetical protein LT493_16805 [Streptomyces tricolor]|nr:hypothetical protein [Streptomyces tricolor]
MSGRGGVGVAGQRAPRRRRGDRFRPHRVPRPRHATELGVPAVLFDVTRGDLAAVFGEDRIATPPATAFPPAAADTEGARLLRTVGVPTGTLRLGAPDEVRPAGPRPGRRRRRGVRGCLAGRGRMARHRLAAQRPPGPRPRFRQGVRLRRRRGERAGTPTRTSPRSSRSPSGSSACSTRSPSATTRKLASSAWARGRGDPSADERPGPAPLPGRRDRLVRWSARRSPRGSASRATARGASALPYG